MKKFAYLSVMFIALALMSFSCEKEDNDVLIPTDLAGAKWNCVSLDYNGSNYTASVAPTFASLNFTKDFVSLDFQFTGGSVTLYTDYTGTNNNDANWSSTPYSYSITGNVLDIDDGYLKFEVISYTATNLKLKMTKGNTDMPIGGTYTLTR